MIEIYSTPQSADPKNWQKIRKLVWAFFILTRLVSLLYSFPCHSDIPFYLKLFNNLQSGLAPYAEFNFEYPPLTLIPIYFAGLTLSKINFTNYYLSFALTMFVADFLCLKLCQNYCRTKLMLNNKSISYMILLYSLFGLLMFRILYHRLDLIVALFFVASLSLFKSSNSKLGTAFFLNNILGFFYKIVPAIVTPPAIILKSFASAKSSKEALRAIISDSLKFLLSLILIILILEICTQHHFLINMSGQLDRGIQIESTFGSFVMFKNLVLGKSSLILNDYGSWNVKAGQVTELVAKILGNFTLLFFYAALFFTFLKKKNRKISEEIFLEATLISILLFLSFQRILSTQFFIWLIPIAVIWMAKNRSPKFLLIFSALFFCTFAIFSIDYLALVAEEPILVTTLFLRNLLLLIFTAFLTIRFFKNLQND